MEQILEHLVKRGLARSSEGVTVDQVSPHVFTASGPGLDAVVKTPATEPEAAALRLVRMFVPGTVPPVLDSHSNHLVLARAPHDWTNSADDLAAGVVDIEVARRLGWLLGRLQRRTASSAEAAEVFADRSEFERLRLAPVHHAVRDAHPELADAVDNTLQVMADADACLVHGALLPRNVLVSPPPGPGITLGARRLWVLDWRVAHFGDPTVDPAMSLSSALVGMVCQPALTARYAACARAFLHALAAERADLPTLDPDQLGRQVGCLLVFAADRKELPGSAPEAEEQLRDLGRELLLDPTTGITDAWKRLS